uniref:Uncharacterized protein n=1 Tax=Anguilla anguilla TaxID=7936 RepID=A0A0E9S094_ANGAN
MAHQCTLVFTAAVACGIKMFSAPTLLSLSSLYQSWVKYKHVFLSITNLALSVLNLDPKASFQGSISFSH